MIISIGVNGVNIEDNKKKREYKGKSIIANPNNYTVIDIETTGLDPNFCEIIELAAIKFENGIEKDRFSTLVKPSYPIDSFITELTGITNEMLENSPSIDEVILDYYNFIKDDILIGHTTHFDINFIYDALQYHKINLDNDYINIVRFANRLLPKLKSCTLESLSNYFKVELPVHRALNDCLSTHLCYQKLLEEIPNQYPSFDDFKKTFNKKGLKAKDIVTTNTEFDENHILYGKTCVFTGKLEHFIRRDAMKLVVDLGGLCSDNVNLKTNYLVLGNNDFCSTIKDGKSTKHKKAEQLILKGQDLEIISENVFLDLLSEE